MNGAEIGIFAVLLVLAGALFVKELYRLFAMMCLGQWENRFDRLVARLGGMLVYAFGQRRVIREKFGFIHLLIFWGFMVLLLVNTQFLLEGVFPDFSFKFLGPVLYPMLLLAADCMSLVVLAAVIVAAVRRLAFRPAPRRSDPGRVYHPHADRHLDDRLLRPQRLRHPAGPCRGGDVDADLKIVLRTCRRACHRAGSFGGACSGGSMPWPCCSF